MFRCNECGDRHKENERAAESLNLCIHCQLTCGNCGMPKVELKKPTSRHSRVVFCTTCGKFSTYVTFPYNIVQSGWCGNDTPPQWAKDAAKKLKRPAYSWA